MTFWDKYNSLCLAIGAKPNTVARVLGFSTAVCTQWKQGLQNPSYDKASKIAQFFDISISQLLDDGEDPDRAFLESLEEVKKNGANYYLKRQYEKENAPINADKSELINYLSKTYSMEELKALASLSRDQAVEIVKQVYQMKSK